MHPDSKFAVEEGPLTEYRQVQGLARGLFVLNMLNRAPEGRASVRQLSDMSGLHRTTVRRLLETMVREGYIRRSESDDSFCVTLGVRALSDGFTDTEWIASLAAPAMGRLLKEIRWPTDLSTQEGASMLVRESTHRYSALSFDRAMIGRRMPLLLTASGRAYLAACSDRERAVLLKVVRAEGGEQAEFARNTALVNLMIERIRHDGYASNEGDWRKDSQNGIFAIAIKAQGRVFGCLNVIYRRRSMTMLQAVSDYLPALQEAVASIETGLEKMA